MEPRSFSLRPSEHSGLFQPMIRILLDVTFPALRVTWTRPAPENKQFEERWRKAQFADGVLEGRLEL